MSIINIAVVMSTSSTPSELGKTATSISGCCDYSSGSPRAFLTRIHLEISDSSYSKNGLSFGGLYYYSSQRAVVNIDHNSLLSRINLSGNPFFFSTTYNMLGAFGCQNYANDSATTINLGQSFCHCDPHKKPRML